jgi:hypothetical protein
MEAMKSRGAKDWIGGLRWAALLAAAVALPGYGQAGRQADGVSGPPLLKIFAITAKGEMAQGEAVQGEVVREIDDPHTGQRWLLVRNGQQSGGPGRLLLVGQMQSEQVRAGQMKVQTLRREPGEATRQIAAAPAEFGFLPVIRAGDRLVVEEHTPVVDALLEARALNPAAQGSALEARLSIGGRAVRVVALGPGRAALLPEAGGRP